MKALFPCLREYRKECVLGPLFKLLEALFELLVPLIVAAIIDVGIAGGDRSYIVGRCLVLVAFGVIGMVCAITAQYFAAKAAAGFAKNMSGKLFRHIQTLSYAELDEIGASTLITRMTSDINQMQTGVNLTLRLLLRSPFVVFGAMIMAFTIDTRAALIFVGLIVALSVVVSTIMRVCVPLYRRAQAAMDRVTGLTRENLSGARVLRAFGREEQETADFEGRTALLAGLQLYTGRISALMNPITYIMVNISIILLLQTGAVRVDAGILTQGAVVALCGYMAQILVELIKLANLIISIAKAVACGNRVDALFAVRPSLAAEDGGACGDSGYAVEFRCAALRYKNAGADAVSGLDFAVKKGETVGVIGGTGSGKTSLVSLIPRFYDVTCGAALVNGTDVRSYRPEELRQKIGVVPQRAVLFSGSIRDNLKWGNEGADDSDMLAALEAAQALDFVREKDGGLDFALEQGGRNLSGGQRQRLTIARALVRKPEILILDDSASALDYATDAALRNSLRQLDGGVTVFIVSQRASSVRHADRIVVLDDGVVAGTGTSAELLDTCSVYREIYETQYRKGEA